MTLCQRGDQSHLGSRRRRTEVGLGRQYRSPLLRMETFDGISFEVIEYREAEALTRGPLGCGRPMSRNLFASGIVGA